MKYISTIIATVSLIASVLLYVEYRETKTKIAQIEDGTKVVAQILVESGIVQVSPEGSVNINPALQMLLIPLHK